MTLGSVLGKASINVFSACACGLSGLGGFDGGASSSSDALSTKLTLGFGEGLLTAVTGLRTAVSCGSSSKSSSLAVVGDSARSFCHLLLDQGCVYSYELPYRLLRVRCISHCGGLRSVHGVCCSRCKFSGKVCSIYIPSVEGCLFGMASCVCNVCMLGILGSPCSLSYQDKVLPLICNTDQVKLGRLPKDQPDVLIRHCRS